MIASHVFDYYFINLLHVTSSVLFVTARVCLFVAKIKYNKSFIIKTLFSS
jgi:hypothetical protein